MEILNRISFLLKAKLGLTFCDVLFFQIKIHGSPHKDAANFQMYLHRTNQLNSSSSIKALVEISNRFRVSLNKVKKILSMTL